MIWPLPDSPAERLALACGYPYAAPDCGFLLRDGLVVGLKEADFSGRTPVLAHGSNRSPEQLGRKFPRGEIPVTCGWLQDYAIVYAACVTRYGACPSLLHHHPKARARVSINWLTPRQLEVMHATEGAYAFGTLEAEFTAAEGPEPKHLHLYHGTIACLAVEGGAVALAASELEACRLPTLPQREVLARIHAAHGDSRPLEAYLLDLINDPKDRANLRRRLEASALPNPLPGFRALVPAPDAG